MFYAKVKKSLLPILITFFASGPGSSPNVVFIYDLFTHGFIPGPGGPCPNCPEGWWCCGKEDQCFNPFTFMCCDDNVTATCGVRRNSFCCGSSCYNPDEEICCHDTVHKKCGENSWCCNRQCYDPDKHHCCDGEIFTCPPGYLCCGRGCYDPNNQLCCERKIIEKCGEETACCGDRCYDTATERCDIDRASQLLSCGICEI